jgi:hypothetical protein
MSVNMRIREANYNFNGESIRVLTKQPKPKKRKVDLTGRSGRPVTWHLVQGTLSDKRPNRGLNFNGAFGCTGGK